MVRQRGVRSGVHARCLLMALGGWLVGGCSAERITAEERTPSSLAVEPLPIDLETTRRWATREALDAAASFSDSALVLDWARWKVSPDLSWVPTLPILLRSRQLELTAVQERIARLKTASRRYFDAADYRAAVDRLPQKAFANVDDRIERVGRRAIRRLPAVDSMSTRRARMLDVSSSRVRAFLHRMGRAHLGVRTDSGVVYIRESWLGPVEEVARIWSIGEPVTVHPVGSAGRNANPMQTRYSVPIYRSGRVYGIVSFNAYSGTVSTASTFEDPLNASRFPILTLAEARHLVEQQTGEKSVRAVQVDPFFDLLLTFPAVLTDEGSVYLVDPLLQAVW